MTHEVPRPIDQTAQQAGTITGAPLPPRDLAVTPGAPTTDLARSTGPATGITAAVSEITVTDGTRGHVAPQRVTIDNTPNNTEPATDNGSRSLTGEPPAIPSHAHDGGIPPIITPPVDITTGESDEPLWMRAVPLAEMDRSPVPSELRSYYGNETFTQPPSVVQAGNHVVVSTNHVAGPGEGGQIPEAFQQALDEGNNLLLEALDPIRPGVFTGTYDEHAVTHFGEARVVNSHPVVDRTQAFVDAGMPRELAGFSGAMDLLHVRLLGTTDTPGWIHDREPDRSIAEGTEGIMDELRTHSQVYRDMTDEQLRENIGKWIEHIRTRREDALRERVFPDFHETYVFSDFFSELELAELPRRAVTAARTLPRQSVIMVAEHHMNAVVDALHRNEPPTVSWEDYAARLSDERRALISSLTELPPPIDPEPIRPGGIHYAYMEGSLTEGVPSQRFNTALEPNVTYADQSSMVVTRRTETGGPVVATLGEHAILLHNEATDMSVVINSDSETGYYRPGPALIGEAVEKIPSLAGPDTKAYVIGNLTRWQSGNNAEDYPEYDWMQEQRRLLVAQGIPEDNIAVVTQQTQKRIFLYKDGHVEIFDMWGDRIFRTEPSESQIRTAEASEMPDDERERLPNIQLHQRIYQTRARGERRYVLVTRGPGQQLGEIALTFYPPLSGPDLERELYHQRATTLYETERTGRRARIQEIPARYSTLPRPQPIHQWSVDADTPLFPFEHTIATQILRGETPQSPDDL